MQTHLREVGRAGHEGLGLWVGRQEQDRFTVVQAVIPVQRHIRTGDGVCVVVGPEELHRLNVWLFRQGLTLFAQIHSHPGRAYHSGTDDENAVATATGCLSLVVPDFAARPFTVETTAVYRLDPKGRWRVVPPPRARSLIRIVE
ncbi:Mov34/MPN/PAD-1 family protein [Methylobacterium sp. Gmos1]